MKYLTPSALTFALFALIAGNLRAQDSELGALPPLPNLDLGDPDRKQSWRERREATQKEEESRREQSVYRRQPEDTKRAAMGPRLAPSKAEQGKRLPVSDEITLRSSLPSADDGITPSGSRLQAFGDADYWGAMPLPTPEESLIDLPPAPDLRTPDQVTRKERTRDLLAAKQERRKAEAEAIREQKELMARAVVNRPAPDPSTALVQVQSQQMGASNFVGNQEAPATVSESTLKPFSEDSSYYKDNKLVYKGNRPNVPVETWWKRGTNDQGGSAPDEPKWRWRNPFGASRDAVQPVSYSLPQGGGTHSAGPAGSVGAGPGLGATSLTSNLRGIRVVNSTRAVSKGALGHVSGVLTEEVELPPRVYEVLASRIGSALTLEALNQMVRESVLAYRRSDLPVVDVLVPEQEISSGVLQLVIIEGRLGDVIVEGAGHCRESRARETN